MHLQIGDDLRTVHNAQLVYSNRQDIALTLLTGFKIWLAHNCQTEEDHLNIKIVTALLLYNACTLLNMMEICVTNNNKLKIHPRGMATFRKKKLFDYFLSNVFPAKWQIVRGGFHRFYSNQLEKKRKYFLFFLPRPGIELRSFQS